MKNQALLPVLFALLIFAGCGQKSDEEPVIPVNILNSDQLATVLADFALAESATNLNIKNIPANKLDSAYAFNPLKDHGVRKSQYDSTLQFYIRYPQLYKQVYDQVLIELTQLESQQAAPKADSAAQKQNAPASP